MVGDVSSNNLVEIPHLYMDLERDLWEIEEVDPVEVMEVVMFAIQETGVIHPHELLILSLMLLKTLSVIRKKNTN